MKLTKEQIEKLYKFAHQHYVEFYDVQTELVDHLANHIEQLWKEKPDLSFEKSRNISFKKFGVFGFMEVVEAKGKEMTKKYFKIVFRFAKEWFQLPKVLLTALLIVSFYKLQFFSKAYFIFIGILFFIVVLELIFLFRNKKQAEKEFKKTGKKWLFKSIININGVGNAIFLFSYIIHFFLPENPNEMLEATLITKLITAFLTTFFIIFGHILLVVIPKKSEELIRETYPEYKMIKNL